MHARGSAWRCDPARLGRPDATLKRHQRDAAPEIAGTIMGIFSGGRQDQSRRLTHDRRQIGAGVDDDMDTKGAQGVERRIVRDLGRDLARRRHVDFGCRRPAAPVDRPVEKREFIDRIMRRAKADGRDGLALYRLATADVCSSQAWQEAAVTPWTLKVRPTTRDRMRIVLKRYVRG